MTVEQCENCKYFAALKKGVGLCCCCTLYAVHVRSVDWCESFKKENRKEQE